MLHVRITDRLDEDDVRGHATFSDGRTTRWEMPCFSMSSAPRPTCPILMMLSRPRLSSLCDCHPSQRALRMQRTVATGRHRAILCAVGWLVSG